MEAVSEIKTSMCARNSIEAILKSSFSGRNHE